MERGEKEQKCLKAVLNVLDNNIYYGFKSGDIITDFWMEEDDFKEIIKSANPNVKPSNFPDFVCNNGLIEHFQITSGEENRNGAAYKRNSVTFDKEYEKNLTEYVKEKDDEPIAFQTYSEDRTIKNHSHENLLNSLKRNMESHIKSLDKYTEDKTNSIFLVQYNDDVLKMREIIDDIELDCSYGDLIRQEKYGYYRMSRDIDALDMIYKYKDKIKYLIFVGNYPKRVEVKSLISRFETIENGLVEIFRVDKIPEIKKWITRKFDVYSPMVKQGRMTTVLTGSFK